MPIQDGYELDPTLPGYGLAWDAYSRACQVAAQNEQLHEEIRAAEDPELGAYRNDWDRHARLMQIQKDMAG